MKKINFHPSSLQVIYLIIYVALFALIIYIPKLISGPFRITENIIIAEEIIEGSLLAILFFVNIWILSLYRHEASRQKDLIKKIEDDTKAANEQLQDSHKYIGRINVQIQEIKSIFNKAINFPVTRNEFRKTCLYLCERVLGIVNSEWVLFRIIDRTSRKTICEQLGTRPGVKTNYPHIGNKNILESKICQPYTSVISDPQNLNLITCCILPVDEISNDERIFIQAIADEVTIMFIIFNYTYREKLSQGASTKTLRKTNED